MSKMYFTFCTILQPFSQCGQNHGPISSSSVKENDRNSALYQTVSVPPRDHKELNWRKNGNQMSGTKIKGTVRTLLV